MTLEQIAFFVVLAAAYLLILPTRWRPWALMGISVLAIYGLQPALPVRWLDYTLPTATLMLTVAGWWVTRPADTPVSAQDRAALLLTVSLALLLSAPRYLALPLTLTTRPPPVEMTLVALAVVAALTLALGRLRFRIGAALAGLLLLFILVKTAPFSQALAALIRTTSGQDPALASPLDIGGWLGFSYVAFRLIHTLRDRQSGLLPALNLREYLTYVIFFPAYTAGPIDRAETFVEELRSLATQPPRDPARVSEAVGRIAQGLAKKFVIADSLALFSLDTARAAEADSVLGLWLMLYAYAFRLFFDFAGYTDIAIGIGLLFGVRLPENFRAPYLSTDIATFWQRWHITLGNWVRFYVYSPLSRGMLRRKPPPRIVRILLISHLSTMLVMGLWHGVALNFALWGLWHGLGLFVHKLWSDRTRRWYRALKKGDPRRFRAWQFMAWALTFHFVVLGWVWFTLPDLGLALRVFGGLVGLGFSGGGILP